MICKDQENEKFFYNGKQSFVKCWIRYISVAEDYDDK